jgi:hypothetical protein
MGVLRAVALLHRNFAEFYFWAAKKRYRSAQKMKRHIYVRFVD